LGLRLSRRLLLGDGHRPLTRNPRAGSRFPTAPRERGEVTRGAANFFYAIKGHIATLSLTSVLLLAPAGAMAQQEAARQACGADIKQMCAEVKPGDGRLKACVKEHFGQLSASCQTALIGTVTITKSCKTDAQQKCPGIQPGGGRIQTCMKDHFTELTEPCKNSLLLAKLQQQ
jgi:Cysteine rich repeat